jgi:predicted acyltransferase
MARYIGARAFALLVMGFFQVNLESYNAESPLPKAIWEIAITVGFFCIWLDYPKDMPKGRRRQFQSGGIALLIVMALLYIGGTPEAPEWLRPQWWGILGLIGWSYLLCAFVFLLSKGKVWVQAIALTFFLLFNIAVHAHWLSAQGGIHPYVWIAGNGAMPALTMGGVFISVLYLEGRRGKRFPAFQRLLVLLGAVAIGLGFGLRFLDGISKIRDTPSWVLICMGISIWVFEALIYLVDVKGKQNWFKQIKPAGTSTLTCYLVPYLLYSIYALCHFRFPSFLNEGIGGLVRSLVTAYVVVWMTGWLEKRRLRLRV